MALADDDILLIKHWDERTTMRRPNIATTACSRRVFLGLVAAALIAALPGCTDSTAVRPAQTPTPSPSAGAELVTRQLSVRVLDVLTAGSPGTVVQAPGWRDYRIEITNRSDQPLMIHAVKVRGSEGRWFAGAEDVSDLDAPPDVAAQVAGDIAARGAGIAAGQVIPYGGTVVGLLSGAARANARQEQASRDRRFQMQHLSNIELAAGARWIGSAYLPDIQAPEALAIDWHLLGGTVQRVELPLRTGELRLPAAG